MKRRLFKFRIAHIFCEDLIPSSVILFDILWFFSSCREWTGDLKKLPNIKLRKVSNKGLDTKNEEKEENHGADYHNEDDLDGNELDDMALMSDWNWDWLNIQGNWVCWNVLKCAANPWLSRRWCLNFTDVALYCDGAQWLHPSLWRVLHSVFIAQTNMHHMVPEY